MENITKQFLKKCKEAGYERVTIFVRDKRVPATLKIKDGLYFGQYQKLEDGTVIETYPHTVVCGHPERLDDRKWPKMWRIVRECGLAVGLKFGGFGLGDAHNIYPKLIPMLTAGYYDLA